LRPQSRPRPCRASGEAGWTGLDLAAGSDFRERIAALSSLTGTGFADAVRALQIPFWSVSGSVSLSGLQMVNIPVPGGPEDFGLDSARVTLDVAGLDDRAAAIDLGIAFAGLTLPARLEPADMVPREASIELGIEGLPVADAKLIIAALLRAIEEKDGGQDGPGFVLAALIASRRLADDFAAGGGRIDIRTLDIAADGAGVRAAGTNLPDTTAELGVTVEAEIAIAGLDRIAEVVAATPEGPRMAALLTLVRAVGVPATGEDGKPLRTFDILIDGAGRIVVNGTDMRPLIDTP
jgi:hypothetical protein